MRYIKKSQSELPEIKTARKQCSNNETNTGESLA